MTEDRLAGVPPVAARITTSFPREYLINPSPRLRGEVRRGASHCLDSPSRPPPQAREVKNRIFQTFPRRDHCADGFTLVELLIVVAIIAILATIAYPSYREHLQKTRRADCEGAMLEMAGALERHYTENNTYAGFQLGTGKDFVDQCPRDPNESATYNLTLPTANASNFTIKAAPTGAQTGDRCGTLTLDESLAKGIESAASGVTAKDCW